MAPKRCGSLGQLQMKRVLRSAGGQPNTDKPPTRSSEFADIGRRAHEQVLQEKAATTQHWVAATGAETYQPHEPIATQTPLGTQVLQEELAHSKMLPISTPEFDATNPTPLIISPFPLIYSAIQFAPPFYAPVSESRQQSLRRDAGCRLVLAFTRRSSTRPS
eukprot:IDg1197t1